MTQPFDSVGETVGLGFEHSLEIMFPGKNRCKEAGSFISSFDWVMFHESHTSKWRYGKVQAVSKDNRGRDCHCHGNKDLFPDIPFYLFCVSRCSDTKNGHADDLGR